LVVTRKPQVIIMSDTEKTALGLHRKSLSVAADNVKDSLSTNRLSISGYFKKRQHDDKLHTSALEVRETVQTKRMKALGRVAVTEAEAAGSLMVAQIISGTTEATAEHKEGIAMTFNKTTQAQSEIAKDAMKGAFSAANAFNASLDKLAEEAGEEGFDAKQIAMMKESSDALAQADTMACFEIMSIMKESDKVAYSRISENCVFDPDERDDDDIFGI